MTRRWAIWLLPLVLALHNLEEGVFFPRYLPRGLGRLPAGVGDWIGPVSLREMGAALALATAIPLGCSVWAAVRPASRTALWLVLAMWATLLLNAAWHVTAALVLFGGYAPGVATAVVLNLPLSVLVLRRAATEQWLSHAAMVSWYQAHRHQAVRRSGAIAVAVLQTACGAGWHTRSLATGPLPPRQQAQVWTDGHMRQWHALVVATDSISGVPFTRPPACDSCRVAVPREAVDSVRLGNPGAGFWKSVGLGMGISVAAALVICRLERSCQLGD